MFRKICLMFLVISSAFLWADISSGPKIGTAVESFKVESMTGDGAGKSIDPVEERSGKPTVYAFVTGKKWSRPCARFLKTLDGEIGTVDSAKVIAIWLTEDVAASKDYLAKVQQSLQFSKTDLAVFPGDSTGPVSWGVNNNADVTVVVVKEGQVTATFGFVSVNETVVDEVMKAVKSADRVPRDGSGISSR